MKLSEIAQLIGTEFQGEDKEIESMNTLRDAEENQLSFILISSIISHAASSDM